MRTCADSTALRGHLDHPDPRLEAHLDACAACTGLLAAVATDAGTAARALGTLDADVPADVDVDAALTAALAAVRGATLSRPRSARPLGARPRMARPRIALTAAVAALAVVVAFTPSGRDAVAQALDGFRGERLQVVAVDPQAIELDETDMAALATLGEVDTAALARPEPVADLAAAQALAGIAAPRLTEEPDELWAAAPGAATLTLRADGGNGVPATLDGARVEVALPGVIAAAYGEPGTPRLVVGRSGVLQIHAVGAPLTEVRAFLLDRPELPEALRAQLATIEDWQTTLPIPVPVDGPGWEEVTVAGRPGLAFGDSSGLGAMVIRQDPDGFTVVAGPRPVAELLTIAGDA